MTTLIHNYSIAISRLKRGTSNQKAFLSKQGEKTLNDRTADFEYLCYSKTDEDFILTAENKTKQTSISGKKL